MVAVFREVRRVLRRDGTCWVNLGDLFVNKQLQMMPARTALALQADGWILRSSIIWHKPNPMPESCTDRPTSAHEHVYLLTRSARYYYDAEAVREDRITDSNAGTFRDNCYINGNIDNNTLGTARSGPRQAADMSTGRNLRNVWTIPTHAYSAAHFATYPPALAERCIRAGTSERGACSQCGKPWARETQLTPEYAALLASGKAWRDNSGKPDEFTNRQPSDHPANVPQKHTTTGWSPACACNADVKPCVVLDCFAGAGTTLLCADRLQRDAIGIELNPSYTEMAMQRCRDDAPLFTAFPPAEDPEEARMADLFSDMAAD
jgi:DNA modification methylase